MLLSEKLAKFSYILALNQGHTSARKEAIIMVTRIDLIPSRMNEGNKEAHFYCGGVIEEGLSKK